MTETEVSATVYQPLTNKLYVGPDCQNRGIGASVIKDVVKRVSPFGLPIRLSVLTTNPTLKFYLREGFSVETETTERRTLVLFSDRNLHADAGR